MMKKQKPMFRRCACCGEQIDIHNHYTFRTINHRKVCLSCSALKKPLLVGSRSHYPSPYCAARFNTICDLQHERKPLIDDTSL